MLIFYSVQTTKFDLRWPKWTHTVNNVRILRFQKVNDDESFQRQSVKHAYHLHIWYMWFQRYLALSRVFMQALLTPQTTLTVGAHLGIDSSNQQLRITKNFVMPSSITTWKR